MVDLIRALLRAREAGGEASVTPDDLPATFADAYSLAMRQVDEVCAWKIGGANPWSQKVFGNTEVFFGPLTRDEVHIDTVTVSLGGLNQPLAEPEIILQLGPDLTLEHPFSRMAVGIEIPASVLPGPCKTILKGQIADRAGAGLLWMSAIQPFDPDVLTSPFTSQFAHNEGEAVMGGQANVIGGPLGAAREFLHLARHYNVPISPGQWIATGGLSPAVAVASGDTIRLTTLGHTLVLRFD